MRHTFLMLLLVACILPAGADTLSVTVEGIGADELRNVLAQLDAELEKSTPGLTEGRIRFLHARASAQIRKALQPFGYYRVKVIPSLKSEGANWRAVYRVEPGPRVLVERLDLRLDGEGRSDPALVRWLETFPLREGDPLDHRRYEEGKLALQKLALGSGYLDGAYTRHELRVDTRANKARIVLHFDSGIRYRFGPVNFVQKDFRDDFLARYVVFKQGDPYSNNALLKLQASLIDSDYFDLVEVLPRRDQAAAGQVPIEVRLTTRKKHRFRAGLGYGTDTGARASVGWQQRRINRRGHKASAELKLAQRLSSIEGRYAVPLKRPNTDELTFSAGASDETTESRESRTLSFGVARSTSRGQWRRTQSLTYQLESSLVGETDENSRMLIPTVTWARSKSDDLIFPRRGLRLELELRGAADALLSDTDFVRGKVAAKWIRGVSDKGRLLVRGQLGAILVRDIDELPASLRFYAGGDQSVRGYGLDELGPEDAEGKVTGGRYLMVGSVEYEHRLGKDWAVAVFLDMGNAYNDPDTELAKGPGFGLRWRSPVGMVRLDLAMGYDKDGRPWRLHLTLGPDL